MGDYTDADRERSQKSITLIEQSIKQNDERYDRIENILERHDERIGKNQDMISRIMTVGGIIAIPITAALAALGKKFIGN